MPGLKQAWPIVAACWSPATPRIGISAPNSDFSVTPKSSAQSFTVGQQCGRDAQDLQQLGVPLVLLDVVDQRARGVGRVGGMHLAAGQPPDQETVDRAGQQFAASRRACARLSHCRAARRSWCRRNRDRAAARSFCVNFFSRPCLLQLLAERRGAPVLPDDGVVDRLAGRLVPDDDGFALVGDADRRDVGGRRARLSSAPPCRSTRRSARSPPDRARPSRMPDSVA